MYVFARLEGEYRAFGGNPAKVGLRVQDVPGTDGIVRWLIYRIMD